MFPCRPCSVRFDGGSFFLDVSAAACFESPGPFLLRLAGGTGGIWLLCPMMAPPFRPNQRAPGDAVPVAHKAGPERCASLPYRRRPPNPAAEDPMSMRPPRHLAAPAGTAIDV